MKTHPNGTTKEEWDEYDLDLKNHEAFVEGRREYLKQILDSVVQIGHEETFKKFTYELDLKLSLAAPNKPGYYRANND